MEPIDYLETVFYAIFNYLQNNSKFVKVRTYMRPINMNVRIGVVLDIIQW